MSIFISISYAVRSAICCRIYLISDIFLLQRPGKLPVLLIRILLCVSAYFSSVTISSTGKSASGAIRVLPAASTLYACANQARSRTKHCNSVLLQVLIESCMIPDYFCHFPISDTVSIGFLYCNPAAVILCPSL